MESGEEMCSFGRKRGGGREGESPPGAVRRKEGVPARKMLSVCATVGK